MTTSLQPWSARLLPNGTVAIKSADGDLIGVILSHRDADLILEALQEQKLLKDKLDELEDTIKDLEGVNEDLRKELNDTL